MIKIRYFSRNRNGMCPNFCSNRFKSSISAWANMNKEKESSSSSSSSHMTLNSGMKLRFYLETYGCQMNVNDSQIVKRILLDAGHSPIDDIEKADLILANTCAIRDNAEAKIWHRLKYFESIGRKRKLSKKQLLYSKVEPQKPPSTSRLYVSFLNTPVKYSNPSTLPSPLFVFPTE